MTNSLAVKVRDMIVDRLEEIVVGEYEVAELVTSTNPIDRLFGTYLEKEEAQAHLNEMWNEMKMMVENGELEIPGDPVGHVFNALCKRETK